MTPQQRRKAARVGGLCCDCPKTEHVLNTYEEGISDPVPVICVPCMMNHSPDYEHDYLPRPRRPRQPSASARLL